MRPARAPARGGGGGPASAKVGGNPATKSARFQKALERLNDSAGKSRAHPPPGKKAAEAQAAAKGPVNEKLAGAKSNQVDSMASAPTGKPEESSFLQLLEAEIEKVIPRTMGETEDFMKGDKKANLQSSLQGNIAQQKQQATTGLQGATAAAPDPSGVPAKEVTAIPAEARVIPPAVGAAGAIPVKKPDSEVSLQQSKQDVKTTLERESITEKQLQKANDPRFSAVLKEKGKVEAQADAGPLQYRKKEGAALGSAMARASADEKGALAGFGGARDKSGAEVKKKQESAKERDEARRKEVADHIEKLFTETKESVEGKLAKLDTEVSERWDRMMNDAVQQMKDHVNARLDAYKDDRYGGVFGWARWIKDKLVGLPDEVNVFYEDGRKLFRKLLSQAVREIAADVEARLKEAKDEIDKGRKRVREYVESLPRDLQAVGKAAEDEVKARFDDLRQAVDDKKQEMASKLSQRAKDAYDASEKALKEIQDANKGLVAKFIEAVGEVIKVLKEIGATLKRILVKAASVIGDIIADPIGFLENLLSAVKRGIGQFKDHFWDHLKAGFMEWLFGAMGEAGIEVPKDFTLGSVLKLVLQVLGLTWDNIRPRIVKLVGPRGMAVLEKAYEVIGILWKGGFAALWDHIKEYLGDLKQKINEELKDFLVVTIVKAAITKIATMFNPVGALIQAIITIYNTVMFFIENIQRILAFVESVIDSIARIVKGDVGGAADYIEKSMARTIPIIIAFLARLLGVSGVAQRVRSAINKLRAMVSKAVDKVLEKLVAGLKSMFGGDKAKADAKKPGEGAAEKLPEIKVEGGEEKHRIYFEKRGSAETVMIQSAPQTLESYLHRMSKDKNVQHKSKAALIASALDLTAKMRGVGAEIESIEAHGKKADAKRKQVADLERQAAAILQKLLEGVPLDEIEKVYALEGLVGTYSAMPTQKGDKMTPDHQPQASLLKYVANDVKVAGKRLFAGRKIEKVAAGHAAGGWTINLHHLRHKEGRTYGSKGSATLATGKADIADALSKAPNDPDKQRKGVIGVLRKHLTKDAGEILKTIKGAANYRDLVDQVTNAKKREVLITRIRAQVTDGERKMTSQPLDDLAEP